MLIHVNKLHLVNSTPLSSQRSQGIWNNLILTLYFLGDTRVTKPSAIYIVCFKSYFSGKAGLKFPFIRKTGKNNSHFGKVSDTDVVFECKKQN